MEAAKGGFADGAIVRTLGSNGRFGKSYFTNSDHIETL
ncbi:hypothetical protein RGUI_1875 [Rhodovulum sp. P5]|nr:hypothetical protein RGUI_1875 [Rhodovulum sp. P5]